MKTNKRNAENKRNNKGFSLVELIVVIAIMAVLVAVAAPQFTRYIDRSRQSVDAQTVSSIVTSAQVGIADVTEYTIPDDTYVITVTNTATGTSIETDDGTAVVVAAAADDPKTLADAIVDSCGELSNLKVTSKGFDAGITIQIAITEGVPTITYDADFAEYIGSDAVIPAPTNP